MSSDVRVTLPLLRVVDAMLQAPNDDHWGFDLMKRTGLKSGTLYPLLARLETAGWVESGWEPEPAEGRPRRRYYRFTQAGAEVARWELANAPGRSTANSATQRLRPATAFGAIA